MFHEYAEDMKDLLPPVDDDCEELSTREIEDLLKQESVERAYKSKKEQLDFISIWQKLIDVNGITAKEMLNMVLTVVIYRWQKIFHILRVLMEHDTMCLFILF